MYRNIPLDDAESVAGHTAIRFLGSWLLLFRVRRAAHLEERHRRRTETHRHHSHEERFVTSLTPALGIELRAFDVIILMRVAGISARLIESDARNVDQRPQFWECCAAYDELRVHIVYSAAQYQTQACWRLRYRTVPVLA
jgi:hypothetical protein